MATPVAPVTAYVWTGPHVGMHAGYGWGNENGRQPFWYLTTSAAGVTTPGGVALTREFDLDGFIGGVHAGYNYQFENRFVLGVEGDIDYANIKGSSHYSVSNSGLPNLVGARRDVTLKSD